MASQERWITAVLLLALVLAGGSAAALDAPRITGVRPLEDRPYLVVDVAYPKAWPETRFTFEADGKPAPTRALGGGFDATSNQTSYLVFPGASCRRLAARWGAGPSKATASAKLRWTAPAFAVLLDRLGDREALLERQDLEFQIFPPAEVRFLQDGGELPAIPLETGAPGQRVRVSPRWHPGLNTVQQLVTAPSGTTERAYTFVLLEDGGLAMGQAAQLVYGQVGSRSGPFYRISAEGDAVAVAGDRIRPVLSPADDGWVLEDQVLVAEVTARASGEAILRIEKKDHFTRTYELERERRIRVGEASPPAGPRGESGLRHDPVEDDPRYAEVFARIDEEVKALVADDPRRGEMGFCHVQWAVKKRLLREKYGIEWRTPDEMTPQVICDGAQRREEERPWPDGGRGERRRGCARSWSRSPPAPARGSRRS